MSQEIKLTIPIDSEQIRALKVGDRILLSGVIVTARDAAHKWMVEKYIRNTNTKNVDEESEYAEIKKYLMNSAIYHCGPIVNQDAGGVYKFISAGPTTSIREELYQAEIIEHFNLRGVIGKGGMGEGTLKACQEFGAVYFHGIGGLGAYYASCVKKVLHVFKLDFGIPEAMWVVEVDNMPLLVTMDSHGQSLHQQIYNKSVRRLGNLIKT